MTDVIGTVLKVMNVTYDGDPKNVGMLPTILSQIDLIETVVKPEDVPTAIKAIRTRLTKTAQAAVGEGLTTFAQVKNALRASCSGEPSWNIATPRINTSKIWMK
jgi:hypothetical protein